MFQGCPLRRRMSCINATTKVNNLRRNCDMHGHPVRKTYNGYPGRQIQFARISSVKMIIVKVKNPYRMSLPLSAMSAMITISVKNSAKNRNNKSYSCARSESRVPICASLIHERRSATITCLVSPNYLLLILYSI